MKYECFLVFANKKPAALVRCWDSNQKLVYGRDWALDYFQDGEPLGDSELVKIHWLARHPSHPAIGYWIDQLKQRQDRKQVVELEAAARQEILELKRVGLKVKTLAERFNVSESTIKRICREKTPTRKTYRAVDPLPL